MKCYQVHKANRLIAQKVDEFIKIHKVDESTRWTDLLK